MLRNSVWLGRFEPRVTQARFRCGEHHRHFRALLGIQKGGRETGIFLGLAGIWADRGQSVGCGWMCLVFVDCLVLMLELKFRVFPTIDNRHRYKLLTNKYSCIFYEKSYIFTSSSESGGFGMCCLLSASVKLQKPANVSCNSQYSILAINH